jgi:hypothetical protein
MSAVLQRIAALANGLSKAELHILIELAARAQTAASRETIASSRELAQKTALARASVQTAIDSLNEKQLIRSNASSATQPAVHHLLCLESEENSGNDVTIMPEVAQTLGQGGLTVGPVPAQILSQGGPTVEPPEAQNLGQGGLKIEPGVAQKLGHGGIIFGPSHNGNSITCEDAHRERANARADSIEKNDFEKTIDRLLKAKKGDYDESLFEFARNSIAGHHAKFARPENCLPGLPDDTITAQFLAVAEWPRLSDLLSDLAAERKEAGHSYGWYVTVALQRIRGISPEQVRDMRRRRMNSVYGQDTPVEPTEPIHSMATTKPQKAEQQLPLRKRQQTASSSVDMDFFTRQIRAMAAAKSMR